MSQNTEAQSFIQRVQALPKGAGVFLDDVLQPSLDDEAELRKIFATDRQNTRLNDKYVGLVDVFDAPEDIRAIRARVVKDEEDLTAEYVMPLSETDRKKEGEPCVVSDLEEFKKNWSVFTEGSLSQLLEWDNVVAAGGAVLACLTPLPESAKASKRAIRKYYHSAAYPTSDVDLFLYGMTPEEAEVKITKIYEAVRDSVPWDVTCVRTKHTVSIHSQYPYRSVQIVLRLYNSPAEILAGFDIDAACFAYDGARVWGNPRAIASMMRQCNTVDMTRRSPSYEVRLAKYSSRGFEVYVPGLKRADVDPTIYERSIVRVEGLARLLVFESLKTAESRNKFLEARRNLRGRPNMYNAHCYRRKKQLRGDLKVDMTIGGLEMNDYDVVSLHIPYGPGWDARRIEKLIYQTDLGMNSPFNPKNKDRRLHRHPAFFGTAEECLQDCCEFCPNPMDEDERKLQKEEDEQYIRGRISFIEEDPGRQSISGSFKPIDVGEWSEQVYIGPTEKFFAAIVANDLVAVAKMIEEGTDVTRRDHVGRMPLHVATMAKREEIACYLIDNGARITSRLADGRTALHLAVKQDMVRVVKRLLERSRVNAELLKKEGESDKNGDVVMKDKITEHPSSEDDWSSDDNGVVSMDEDADVEEDIGDEEKDEEEGSDSDGDSKKDDEPPQTPDPGDFLEDKEDEPDVFDINASDWDSAFTPLDYAILFASMPIIDALLDEPDIDLSLGTKAKYSNAPTIHPLSLTVYHENEDEAAKIVERLVVAGASCSVANDELETLFVKLIHANKTQLVLTLLRVDPKAMSVINFPYLSGSYNPDIMFPIVFPISNDNYAMLAALVGYGAKIIYDEEDVTEALQMSNHRNYYNTPADRTELAVTPLEVALATHSDAAHLLISLGVKVDIATKLALQALRRYGSKDQKKSLLEWVQFAIHEASSSLEKLESQPENTEAPKIGEKPSPWKAYCIDHLKLLKPKPRKDVKELEAEKERTEEQRLIWKNIKAYFTDAERLLLARNAKTYKEIYPTDTDAPEPQKFFSFSAVAVPTLEATGENSVKYEHMSQYNWNSRGSPVPQHQVAEYDELFEACLVGDNATIQRLCVPDAEGDVGRSALQITVMVPHADGYSQTGLTPLALAVANRHWETARLIFTISAAQYQPEGKETKFRINLEGFHEDDSDDEGSDADSEASDETINRAPIDFKDVAKRSAKVHSRVPPSKMLDNITVYWRNSDGSMAQASNLIRAAVDQNDVQAFGNVLGLYKLSDPPVPLNDYELDNLLTTIINKDSVELLNEYIKRTGRGVHVKTANEGHEEEETRAVNDGNKVYYGLNVHGKKRRDLARKNDPNANQEEPLEKPPLVWRAAAARATRIVDYLKSDRPLEAYRYYAMCNGDELAISLRRTNNLEKVLSQWLGWSINSLGESPLSSAILSQKLAMVKQMFALDPKLMSSALKENIKFIGYNLLMVAVKRCCTTKMVDFLLSNGLSPMQTDIQRGWNIYHILATRHGDFLLFEHFLKKLPREASFALLMQQSKGQLYTPLHMAVDEGRYDVVQAIVDFDKSSLLIRDTKGSLPLHTAVANGYDVITKMLIQATPEVLHCENGVGNTPLEIATGNFLLSHITEVGSHVNTINNFVPASLPTRRDVEKLEDEIPKLRQMIATLVEEKKFIKDSKPEKEFSAFARYLETQLASAKPEYEVRKKRAEEKVEKDKRKEEEEMKKAGEEDFYRNGIRSQEHSDPKKTYKVVKGACDTNPGERRLVHLVDVQKSIQGDLSKVKSSRQSSRRENDKDELELEEDKEMTLRKASLVFDLCDIEHV
ncbi:ankyrin [Marasmius fiardii PR-910]|nr:ankyrin [Marasmius fiardii PR-910]